MAVLVTGAAGFLGSRLVERLAALGEQVVAIARGPKPPQWSGDDRVVWMQRDIARDGVSLDQVSEIDAVYHLAGATLGEGSDEWCFLEANESTTVRLLQACAGRVMKVVYASSQVVYGDASHLAVTEDFPLKPASAYACSKVNGEQWLRWFQHRHGGTYLSLRFCGFVEGGGLIGYITERALRNEPIELFSSGLVRRDYLAVNDGIEAFVAALHHDGQDDFVPLNIGSGQCVSAFEAATLICDELHSSSEIIRSTQEAAQADFVFDIARARRILQFEPGELRQAIRHFAHATGSAPAVDCEAQP